MSTPNPAEPSGPTDPTDDAPIDRTASDEDAPVDLTAPATLHHTQTGGKLHLRRCPHLAAASPILDAAPDDSRPICVWSQHELNGTGRTYHQTLADALEDFGAAQSIRPELTRLMNLVEWDEVFVPYSRAYVTVHRNGLPVAWCGKNYVDYPNRPIVRLPDFVGRDVDGIRQPDRPWGPVCPDCSETRSLSGACNC